MMHNITRAKKILFQRGLGDDFSEGIVKGSRDGDEVGRLLV